MITITTNTTLQTPPTEYRKHGECPHCGAPIYADARCFKGKKVIAIPMSYYTCGCWLRLQPQIITTIPCPAPDPLPLQPTWRPWPNTTPISPNQCGDNINILDDGHKTICKSGIDWKQFCGSGGTTQDPELTKRIICLN